MPDTSELGTTTRTSPDALSQAEPRASNNRLSIDPNDPAFAFAQDWEDGMDYTVELRVTQTSPGEFEVVSGEEVEGGETEMPEERRGAMGAAGEETEPNTSPRGGTGFRNPVLADVAAEY